jgi:hypothetical protein
MEAIAVIGGVSAILSIAKESAEIAKRLCNLAKTLYHAQKEVQDISKEVQSFSRILLLLDDILDSAQSTELTVGRASTKKKLVQELVKQSRSLLKEFGRLREKLKPLIKDQSTNTLSRTIARLRWSRNKSSTTDLRRALDSHKITLNLLLTTILLGEKVAECKRYEQRGESVPEKLKMKMCGHLPDKLSCILTLIK